jgi:hypothetical protein
MQIFPCEVADVGQDHDGQHVRKTEKAPVRQTAELGKRAVDFEFTSKREAKESNERPSNVLISRRRFR